MRPVDPALVLAGGACRPRGHQSCSQQGGADMGEEHASIVRRRYLSIFVGIVLLQALDRPVLGNPDVTILAASLGPLLVPLFWFSCPARRHNTSLAKMIKTPKCDGLHLSLSGWPCIGLCHSRVAGRRRHSGGCPILLFHGREVSEFHTHTYIQIQL